MKKWTDSTLQTIGSYSLHRERIFYTRYKEDFYPTKIFIEPYLHQKNTNWALNNNMVLFGAVVSLK